MAAISALMINDSALQQKEKHDERRSSSTPKPTVRVQSPKPSDIATIPEPEHEPEPEPEASVAIPDAESKNEVTQESAVADSDKGSQTSQNPENKPSNPEAMDMDASDDDKDGSDNEGDQDDDGSGGRKKKGQRFFCTGYPPCNLSFTRSEHLARHIRKHTGERPFQCHCNRRFSRLDNLRQHAQTVHVNEEIPQDSLAATGTRYQRQIRTDRVRPAPRPRTSTMSSSGSHGRGHSRNLSTSSIASTSSIYSNATDVRRRPPPLLMAGDNRPTTPPTYSNYPAPSPGDLGTPTSATYPATPGSPNFTSVLQSPISTQARMNSYLADARAPARRLSVPSSVNPYQPQYATQYGPSYGPGPAISSTNPPSLVTSPTSTTFPGQNVPMSSPEDWRRRTWHPSTYPNPNVNYNRPATSGLTYSQTPDAPQPAYAHNAMSAAGQAPRLPGIESFDHVQHRPSTPPRRNPTPPHPAMNSPQPLQAPAEINPRRRGHMSHASWDGSRRSQYPDIDENGRPTTSWGQDTMQQLDQLRENHARRSIHGPPVMGPPLSTNVQQSQQIAKEALDLQTSASKRVKRSGHYSGTGSMYRTSPDSSSSDGVPTPGTSAAEIHPTIMHSNGFIEPQLLAGDVQHTPCLAPPMPVPQPYGRYHPDQRHMSATRHVRSTSNLDRLEALVAVATSETSTR